MHWKALDTISNMNNETKFAAPTHNLLLKKRSEGEDHHFYRNMNSNTQASPQAARKKRFMPLNLKRS
jgi:hypothetical protein